MQTSLRKMGNSTGVIIPKPLLDELGLACGAKVDVRVVDGEVVVSPARRPAQTGWEDAARLIGAEAATAQEQDWLEFDDAATAATDDGAW